VDECPTFFNTNMADKLDGASLDQEDDQHYSFILWRVIANETWQLTLPMRKIDD